MVSLVLAFSIFYVIFATLPCNTEICPESWRGDGICDVSCMTPECGFDRSSNKEIPTGDCLSSCQSKGCIEQFGADSICHDACNIPECGFDSGSCGVCAPHCKDLLLGDGKCDSECDFLLCDFDSGDCVLSTQGKCASGCFPHMLGNGICDLACLSQACENDGGDCWQLECSPGCYPYMLGDYVCNSECHNAQCQWDGEDCDCSPGCIIDLKADGNCDPECDNALCDFDNGECVSSTQGDCASGCFRDMLGNHVCDEQCYNEGCGWDGMDCGCAADCKYEELGTCKTTCLVADCNYDRLLGFASCLRDELRTAALYYQLEKEDFTVGFSYEETCFKAAQTCDIVNWTLSATTCVQGCDLVECGYSFGNCVETGKCASIPNCKVCHTDVLFECLECLPGFFNFFQNCVSQCPLGFSPHPLVTTVCYPDKDTSSQARPHTIFVQAKANPLGTGSYSQPFDSLNFALTSIHMKFTRICVLAGRHELVLASRSAMMHAMSESQIESTMKSDTELSISGWRCEEDTSTPPHPQCATENPVFVYQNLKPVVFDIRGNVTIAGVDFDGNTSFLPGCEYELCMYCPKVTITAAGVGVGDKGSTLTANTFAPLGSCTPFHGETLFSLTPSASLTLLNLRIANFRQEFSSLFSLTTGYLLLRQVEIRNVVVWAATSEIVDSFFDIEAVIVQKKPKSSQFLAGSVVLDQVSVSLLGNGFEYSHELFQGGFLSVSGLETVSILNSSLRMITVQNNFLLNVGNFSHLIIRNCVFASIFTGRSMIRISPTVSLPIDYIVDEMPYYYYLDHIEMENNTIAHCSTYMPVSFGEALIAVVFNGEILNTKIENVTVTECYSQGAMVTIRNKGSILVGDKQDMNRGVLLPSGRIVVLKPKKWVQIHNMTIDHCVTTSTGVAGLLTLITLPNVDISGLKIEDSGDGGDTESVNTKTIAKLMEAQDSYIDLFIPSVEMAHCERIVSLEGLYNVSLSYAAFRNTSCLSVVSTSGIHTSALLGNFSMRDSSFMQLNNSSTSMPSCLNLDATGRISITDITIRNCSGKDMGAIAVTGSTALGIEVVQGRFSGNRFEGALVQALFAYALTVADCEFDNNESLSDVAVYFRPQLDISKSTFIVVSSQFRGNTGIVISLQNDDNNAIPVLFTVAECTFSDNSGMSVFLQSTNILSVGSSIHSCRFDSNESDDEVVSLSLQDGIVDISDCEFVGNNATNVILVELPEYLQRREVLFHRCTFQRNSAAAVVYFHSTSLRSLITCESNQFLSNTAISISNDGGFVSDSHSLYRNNTGTALYLTSQSAVNFSDSIFSNGSAVSGGAVYVGDRSTAAFHRCHFEGNHAEQFAGVAYIEQDSLFIGTALTFHRNTASKRGSSLYLFGTSAHNIISSCLFTENESGEGGTIAVLSSSLSLLNSTIASNIAPVASGVLCYFSTVFVASSTFSDQSTTVGAFLYCAIESQIAVIDSNFTRGNATIQGGAMYVLSAKLVISRCQFYDISANHGALLSANARADFSIVNSTISAVTANSDFGGAIYAIESTGFVGFSSFQNYSSGAIVGYQLLSISISHSEFRSNRYSDGKASKGAGLKCTECQLITIWNSVFQDLTGSDGVAIYATTSAENSVSAPVIVANSEFRGISGVNSGAVYLENLHASLQSSSFVRCSANGPAGSGGALSLHCSGLSDICRVSISLCEFSLNHARVQGGSIYWTDSEPLLSDTVFESGSAYYGPDIASFPYQLRLLSISGNATSDPSGTDSTGIPIVGTMFDLASGQLASQIVEVALVDHYGQTFVTDNRSTATLLPGAHGVGVIGNMSVTALRGIYQFRDFGVSCSPGNSSSVYISTSGIDQNTVKNSSDETEFRPTIGIAVVMRPCMIGETLLSDQCIVCPAGKYSFDPYFSCKDCHSGAICYGNFTMVPKAGWWRRDALSEIFWECPFPGSCIGSPVPPLPLAFEGRCLEGYYGNLCNGCMSGYSRQNFYECGRCPSLLVNIIRIVGIGIAVIIALVIIIRTAINSAKKPRSHYSIFIKILLNYLQLVMLTSSFQMKWPTYMKELFRVQQSAGSVTDQFFSIDCFLDNSQNNSQADVVRSKLVVIAMLPIGLFCASLVFWVPIAMVYRRLTYLKNELATTNVVFFFLVHPSIVKFMFDVFNCRQLDSGEYWMSSYLNIPCWDTTHYRYSWIVAAPSIIGWGLGVPTLCLIILWRRKRMLDLTETKLRLGFVYNGYEHKKFYWEFVILYRKIAIICISVFLTNISTSVQALTVMVVLLAAFALQVKHQPYLVNVLNDLELRAILVSTVTIYCGLYYMTNDLDASGQLILFVVVIAVNAYFVLYWLVKAFRAGLVALSRRFHLLEKIFCKQQYRVQPRLGASSGFNGSSVNVKIGESISPDASRVRHYSVLRVRLSRNRGKSAASKRG